jgi:hypothetical protein
MHIASDAPEGAIQLDCFVAYAPRNDEDGGNPTKKTHGL